MNTWTSWKTDRALFLLLLGLIFISHLPFIEADPDRNMSVGRGPFTDEGLNTIQARNWVNHGTLNLEECDNFLKTPLLGFPLALTYKIFGVSHAVSRLHVLILVFLALLAIGTDPKHRLPVILFSVISMMQYSLYHSSHYSMAEMLSTASVILSIHFLSRAFDPAFSAKKRSAQAALSGLFLSLAYYLKIQFIYLIPLIPIVLALLFFWNDFLSRKMIIRNGFIISSTLLFFLLLYFLAWYLPNKEAYDFMMAHQSGEFSLSGKIWEYVRFNFGYHFMKGWLRWYIYLFTLITAGGFVILKHSKSRRYRVFFLASLTWFLLEAHKLMMVYLPTRYQVSLLASTGLVVSVVLAEMFFLKATRTKLVTKALALLIIIFLGSVNIYSYFDALKHRTYVIREANEYLARGLEPGDLVLGAWAPSMTWEAGSRALPVWNGFLNYERPLERFNPRVIIAESDEQDSEQAWKNQGIDLQALSDSARIFRIGHWDVNVYWVKRER